MKTLPQLQTEVRTRLDEELKKHPHFGFEMYPFLDSIVADCVAEGKAQENKSLGEMISRHLLERLAMARNESELRTLVEEYADYLAPTSKGGN